MSRQPGSRQRLVDATLRLLSRQGYEATAVKDIARAGDAPMGSFYYHFPGGKEELAVAAMQSGAEQVGQTLGAALAGHDDPAEALAACALAFADRLAATQWRDGCPVAPTALETVGRSTELQRAAAEAFTLWHGLIRRRLQELGLSPELADELADTTLALIEGAEMVARVRGTQQPLTRAADALRILTRARVS